MLRSATIIAAKERALSRKHGATPRVAMISPAPAGPRMRAEWIRTLFRLTALTTRAEPTISIAKLWRAGLSTELTAPRAKTRAKTIHGATTPVAVNPHRARAGRAMSV